MGSAHERLSKRERQIAELTAQGLCAKETAARLAIAPGTVKVYLSTKIYRKLGVSGQPGLVRYWMERVEMPQRGDCSTCCHRQIAMGGPDLVALD